MLTTRLSKMRNLVCSIANVCLSDCWSGHHLAHCQIPVYHGMTLKAIKDELHSELNQGAIAGNEPLTRDDSGIEGDKWFKSAHAAVNRIKPATKGQRRFFTDLDKPDDYDYDYDEELTVYAFFVFIEV